MDFLWIIKVFTKLIDVSKNSNLYTKLYNNKLKSGLIKKTHFSIAKIKKICSITFTL